MGRLQKGFCYKIKTMGQFISPHGAKADCCPWVSQLKTVIRVFLRNKAFQPGEKPDLCGRKVFIGDFV
jgi:hypothetical protein